MNDDKPKSNKTEKKDSNTNTTKTEEETVSIPKSDETKPICGVVMPISPMGEHYPASHWVDVLDILDDVALSAGFKSKLVSEADEVSVIQKTIIQNLYSNEIVIVDVSNKNANVMFELGIRLAFDKPTIIIKDNATEFIFDTGVIEHLVYPKDLRYQTIKGFKDRLKNKLNATLDKSKSEPNYSPFLKNFGQYKVATLESNEVSENEFISKKLDDIFNEIKRKNILTTDIQKSSRISSGLVNRIPSKFVNKKIIGLEIDFNTSSNIEEVHISTIISYFKEFTGFEAIWTRSSQDAITITLDSPISNNQFLELQNHLIGKLPKLINYISPIYLSPEN